MSHLFHRRPRAMVSLPPGTPVFSGTVPEAEVSIDLTEYDADTATETKGVPLDEALAARDRPGVAWINLTGIHNVEIVQRLCDHYGVHPLVQEDIVSTGQRPKLDEYDGALYGTVRMLRVDPDSRDVAAEQVSMVLGKGWVLSFQECDGDVFDPIRGRIRQERGRVRTMPADYLFYSLIDAIVDGCFGVLERIGERVEELEEDVFEDPRPATLQAIQRLRTELIYVRKSVWPLREVVNTLEKTENPVFTRATRIFLRDLYDHTVQLIETVETFRDQVGGLFDMYMSSVGNRMNEVMKVLTIIATIFIPITFIAGVYGMNFQHMPELAWRWAYPTVWAVMILVTVGMLIYFRRKDWL